MTINRDNVSPEIRAHFESVLETLRTDTIRLGATVLENARRLTESVLENDLELAQAVVDADGEVDALYAKLEREAFQIIARQQPVATDLRFLISITRILFEIERSGDLAVNCAQGLLRQSGYEIPEPVERVLARLFKATTDIFGMALDALAEMDPNSGMWLDTKDDVVDDLTAEFYDQIVGEGGRIEDVDLAVEMARTGRYLERIADHAVNIGEHITFVATGSFREDREGAEA